LAVPAFKARVALALSAALSLTACELAPEYQTPAVSLPSQFTDAGGASGGVIAPGGEWWNSFGDAQLDALEGQVDAANPDLAAAYAAYQFSRARAEAAVSGAFPEIDVGGGLSANKQSANRPLRSNAQPTFYGANQVYGEVANYELDVWGRVADIIKAAKANAQAAEYALADARLSLHAELARDYFQLRSLDAEAKLLADTIKLYQSALDLTRQRLDAKIAPPVDAQRAVTQVESVRAQASDLALRRSALVDAIAMLTGKAAAGYRLNAAASPSSFPRRPRAVPGDVLRRRPDVAQAERDFAAANALIGAARANMYPKFTLSLMGGTQDTSLRLLDPANTFYSIGPAMSVPLFDFGLRQAELKEAEAQAKIAAERYRSTVLQAVKEVQDDLSALRWLAAEASQTEAAARAAGKALDMSMALYRDGAASYLDVVTAQDSALQTQRAAIGVRARQFDAYVGLIMALGGGWSVPYPEQEPKIADAAPE
jgi:NodT family efflux transporter outer membrane factor (OMF) lipoprotein